MTKVMATEITGDKGHQLVQETIEDIGIEQLEKNQQRAVKKTAMMPKELVEGLFSGSITELKNAMDALFLVFFDKETGKTNSFNTQKKKLDAIKATLVIFVYQLDTVRHCLEPYTDATMNLRHRRVKSVCSEGLKRLKKLEEPMASAKQMNHWAVIKFAKEMALLMTNFHCVLHKDTPKKETNRIVKEYCVSEEV